MPVFVISKSYLGLLTPGIISVVCIIIGYSVFVKYSDGIDKWLVRGRRNRLFFFSIFVVLIPILLAVLADWADISEVAKGTIGRDDIVLLSIGAFLVSAYIWAYAIWHRHTDKWEERVREHGILLQKAQRELIIERTLHKNTLKYLNFVLATSRAFLNVVGLKAQRVQGLYKDVSSQQPSDKRTEEEGMVCERLIEKNNCNMAMNFQKISKVVAPDNQIAQLIMLAHRIFEERLDKSSSLRASYFHSIDGYMQPVYSWDGKNEECVTTPRKIHREKFSMASKECLVVSVALSSRIEVVVDAEQSDKNLQHPFKYHDVTQREKIKSLVAIPLKIRDTPPDFKPVLVVDTNEANFLKKYNQKELEHIQETLSNHLLAEIDMKLLLDMLKGRS